MRRSRKRSRSRSRRKGRNFPRKGLKSLPKKGKNYLGMQVIVEFWNNFLTIQGQFGSESIVLNNFSKQLSIMSPT